MKKEFDIDYQDLKTLILGKELKWNYIEDDMAYTIFAKEGTLLYSTMVYKSGQEPKNFDTSQNDTDRTDFEGNYKSSSNSPDAETIKSTRINSLVYGHTTVTTGGTAVILTSPGNSDTITVKALPSNNGNIYVGDTNVDSTNGFVLQSGESVSIDLNHNDVNVFIDADTNGEGVCFICGTIA